jgi:hypothetical protein
VSPLAFILTPRHLCDRINSGVLARTSLHCEDTCASPSDNAFPFIAQNTSLHTVQLSSTVSWQGCKTIYATCDSGLHIVTYNSFLQAYRLYNRSTATVYCGGYQQYYMLYKLSDHRNFCSNSFDYIDCVGMCVFVACLVLVYTK